MTNRDHGEQDVAGSGGLKGSYGRVDERVHRRGSEDQSSRQEADNLAKSANASCAQARGQVG